MQKRVIFARLAGILTCIICLLTASDTLTCVILSPSHLIICCSRILVPPICFMSISLPYILCLPLVFRFMSFRRPSVFSSVMFARTFLYYSNLRITHLWWNNNTARWTYFCLGYNISSTWGTFLCVHIDSSRPQTLLTLSDQKYCRYFYKVQLPCT